MDSPFVFAWMASITYGLYAIVAKLTGKYQLQNVWQFSFFSILFGGVVTTIISLHYGARWTNDWWPLFVAAFFLAAGSTLYLIALKNLDVSVMAPLFNIRVVITVLLGFLLLGEVVSVRSAWLIALVVGAGFFATMDERFSFKSFFTTSVAIGLLYMLVKSLQSLFINRAIAATGYWTANLWMGILAVGFAFVFLYPKFKHDLKKTRLRDYVGVMGLSVIGGLSDLLANKAFEGNVGISSVIISLPISMVLAFGFSVFKPELLEKHLFKVYVVRFVAAAVMIWGALQLST